MNKATNAIVLSILVIFGCGAAAACVRFHVPPAPSHPSKYRKKLTDVELAAQLDAAAVAADEAAALAAEDAAAATAPYAPTPENNTGTTERKVMGVRERDSMNQERAAVSTNNDDPSYYPLEKVNHGFFRLLARINSPEDVTVANFLEAMQFPETLGKNQHIWDLNVGQGSISFNSDVPRTEWTYSLGLSKPLTDGKYDAPGITLRFEHPKNDNNHEAEKTSICAMDYEAYKHALLAQGFDAPSFEPSELTYFSKGGMSYNFTRGSVAVTIYTEREGADTEAKKSRACPVLVEVVAYTPAQLQGIE